jgi:lauroyl/myristoyl acyltransferase
MSYWLYGLAAWLLPRIHDAVGYALAGLIGSLAYAMAAGQRALVGHNMRIVLGENACEREVRLQTRIAFQNLARNYYELFHLPGLSQDDIRKRIDMTGVEHIDDGLQGGRGVLLAGMHLGNFEYLMQIPTFFPHMRFTLLIEKMANARVFELMRNLRSSMGMELAAVDEPLKVVRYLKQNRVVGIAIDRDVTHSGIEVSFLGKPAIFPDGVIRLAMRTGAAIVPAFGWSEKGKKHVQVRVLPVMNLVSAHNGEADVRLNLERLLANFEPVIRAHPGQWMAFHQVWKGL